MPEAIALTVTATADVGAFYEDGRFRLYMNDQHVFLTRQEADRLGRYLLFRDNEDNKS